MEYDEYIYDFQIFRLDTNEVLDKKTLDGYLEKNDCRIEFREAVKYHFETHPWFGGLNSNLYEIGLQAK